MPLARIISTSAKYSNGLADDLRSRGFQVLTSAPGDTVSESADLEITLNECWAEEARAAVAAAETKDMRVFLTPQAFAGNIRSIEMFVLTPKRVAAQKLEAPVDPPKPVPADGLGRKFEFAPPVAAAPHHDVVSQVSTGSSIPANDRERKQTEHGVSPARLEGSSDSFEKSEATFGSAKETAPMGETTPSSPQSSIGRAILASRQSAWPDMAEMKLVPAELAPAPVRSLGGPLQTAALPERTPAGSVRREAPQDMPFWKAPVVAGIAAVLALSAIWLATRSSTSHTQAATTLKQVAPSSAEATTPAASAVSRPGRMSAAPSPAAAVAHPAAIQKMVRTSGTSRTHESHTNAKRHYNPDDDYVAKDTTVYFSKRASGSHKSQAQP
jgi:hypothetical protein